jgi:hypothetical protein
MVEPDEDDAFDNSPTIKALAWASGFRRPEAFPP